MKNSVKLFFSVVGSFLSSVLGVLYVPVLLMVLSNVIDYITNKNPKATDSEISKYLGVSKEIVEAVMGKPISHLRKNKDTTERIKSLKSRLTELKNFDPIKFTEKIINEL